MGNTQSFKPFDAAPRHGNVAKDHWPMLDRLLPPRGPFDQDGEAQLTPCSDIPLVPRPTWPGDPGYADCLWPHACGSAWIVPKRLGRNRAWRSWRRCPRRRREIEELQQIGLRCIAWRQMRGTTDEPVLNELDHRCMIHRRMRYIMFPGEW